MTLEEKYAVSEKIEKHLRDNGVFAEVTPYWDDLPVIEVSIHWGDWKHDHLRAKWLLEGTGVHFINTLVTEEDGSDTYSAVHRFYVPDVEQVKVA